MVSHPDRAPPPLRIDDTRRRAARDEPDRGILSRIMSALGAEAALLHLDGAGSAHLVAVGFSDTDASAAVAELRRALPAGEREARLLRPDEASGLCAAWPSALAAPIETDELPKGHLAVFAARPDAFDPDRDGRLLAEFGWLAATSLVHRHRAGRLERSADQLTVRIEELERIRGALERHSRDIERSLAVRSRFFAAMSHELRTPINAIVGYGDLLQQGVFGALNEAQSRASRRIVRGARQLLDLLDDLLDLSRLDSGRLPIRPGPIDLTRTLREAVASIEVTAMAKGLTLDVECEPSLPTIESDGYRVRQILLNLLSNAVKFTHHGSITLRASRIPPRPGGHPVPDSLPGREGWIAISVRDTGIGIPDEQLRSIFEAFVRVPRTSEDVPGTGLGLAISGHLARLLGGELRVESEYGEHSTFTLFLPCPAPADAGQGLDAHAIGRPGDQGPRFGP